MWKGTVVSLHIAPGAAETMKSLPEVRAITGNGLEHDRYHDRKGTYSSSHSPAREVTLIEEEAIDALRRDYKIDFFDPGDSRRNIITRGVALNHLVGRQFRVGEVSLRGIRLCEPCHHLEEVSGRRVREGLVHRGGLRATIVKGGTIRIGDPIEPTE